MAPSPRATTQFAQYAAVWLPLAVNVAVTSTLVSVHVAHGMTRRAFIQGSLIAAVINAALCALVVEALVRLETLYYRTLGWTQGVAGQEGVTWSDLSVWTHLWGVAALMLASNISGLIVGMLYFRLDAVWGTVAVPAGLLPVSLVSVFGLNADTQFAAFGASVNLAAPWPALAILAAYVFGVVVFYLLTRRVRI